MKNLLLFLVFIAIGPITANAQAITESVDPKVGQLMQRFVDINKSQTAVSGWRIQLLATPDRQNMETELRRFSDLFPSIPVDWLHAKPYFKVRAGAFATKREALRTLYIIKADYPGAYPVQDNQIKPQELLR